MGWGFPKDIVPSNVPSETDLENYLNSIYVPQANVHFDVTRSDFACDYDVARLSGTLVALVFSKGSLPGEDAIYAHRDATAQYNLYYVLDFIAAAGLSPSGQMIARPNIAGITHYDVHVAVVTLINPKYILNTSAHEIGHLLDLGHPSDPYLPDGNLNPAYRLALPDPSPNSRLMSSDGTESPTRLVKPELDIININKEDTQQ